MNREVMHGLRNSLKFAITSATELGQQIATLRGELTRTEDVIINEIWNNPEYKNDKARNEQKHLSRINDERYINLANRIASMETRRAAVQGLVLVRQSELRQAEIEYAAALAVPQYVADQAAEVQPVAVVEKDVTTIDQVEVNFSLRQRLAEIITPDKLIEVEDSMLEGYVPAQVLNPMAKAAGNTDATVVDVKASIHEGDNAPYLKNTNSKANTGKLPGTDVRF